MYENKSYITEEFLIILLKMRIYLTIITTMRRNISEKKILTLKEVLKITEIVEYPIKYENVVIQSKNLFVDYLNS